MKEFPGFFVHWQHFDNAKAFRNAMQELGIYLAFKDFIESHVNFLDKTIKNAFIAKVHHEM